MPKYRVGLYPGPSHEFEAEDERDAIAQYNAWSGVISSDHQHSVERLDQPVQAAKEKAKNK